MPQNNINYLKYRNHNHKSRRKMNESVTSIPRKHFILLVKIIMNRGAKNNEISRDSMIMRFAYSQYLRMDDVLCRLMSEIFDGHGRVRTENIPFHDKKTDKADALDLRPIKSDLVRYKKWRNNHGIHSKYLFPAYAPQYHQNKKYGYHDRPLSVHTFYNALKRYQYKLHNTMGWSDKLSCHLPRKQAAEHLYHVTHDLYLVQHELRHSYPETTEKYLHLKTNAKTNVIDQYYDGL